MSRPTVCCLEMIMMMKMMCGLGLMMMMMMCGMGLMMMMMMMCGLGLHACRMKNAGWIVWRS